MWCLYKVYGQHVNNIAASVRLHALSFYQLVKEVRLMRNDPLRVKVAIAHGRWAWWLSITWKPKHNGEDVSTPIRTSFSFLQNRP